MTLRPRWLHGLCLLAFLALQVWASSQKSFWEDEAYTAASVQRSIPELLAHPEDIDAYKPPLYFLVASAWGSIVGYEELPLSALSILFSGVACVLIVSIASRMGGQRNALVTSMLLALSPLLLSYAHSARYYALAMLLVACSVSIVLALHKSFQIWALGAFVLVNIAQFYTIYTLMPVTLACFAWLGIALVLRRQWRQLALWMAAQGIVALGCLPWLNILIQGANTWTSTASLLNQPVKSLPIEIFKRLGFLFVSFTSGETLVPTQVWALLVMAMTLTAVGAGVWTLWHRRSASGFLVCAVLTSGVVFGVLVNIAGVYPDNSPAALPRRILFVYPMFVLLAGMGFSSMRKPIAISALLVLLVCQAASVRNYFTGQQYMQPIQAVPWRTIMQAIRSDVNPNTVVICSTGDTACSYFVRRFGLPESNLQAALAAPQAMGDIWYIQSNIGSDQHYDRSTEAAQFDALKLRYRTLDTTNYVQHDPDIRALKRQLSGRTDYEYRVTVLHLREPIQ